MADPFGLIFDGEPELGAQEQAAETYAKLPATFGQKIGENVPATAQDLASALNAGLYEDSLWGRATRSMVAGGLEQGMAEGALPLDQELLNPAEPLADKKQRPADAINKLAGAHITDVPMGEHLSDILIEAKQRELERERINERYADAHSWPVNFGTELVSGMLDPANAATLFVPGLGEEALLARLGSGLLGRVAARGLAQAAGTEVAQLPVEALRYGLARETNADFDLRSAFSDLAMGAAYGAIGGAGHALLGAGWNALRGRVAARVGAIPELPAEEPPIERPPLPTGPPAGPEEEASRAAFAAGVERATAMRAPEVNAAIGTAVGQIATERPVDVEPLVQLRTPELPEEEPEEVAPLLGLSFLPPPARPLRPGEAPTPITEPAPELSPGAAAWWERHGPRGEEPADIVAQQRDLDRVGVFPGTPQNELAATAEEARLAAERAAVSRETSPQGDVLKPEQARAPEDWIATAPGAPGPVPVPAAHERAEWHGPRPEDPLALQHRGELTAAKAAESRDQLRAFDKAEEDRLFGHDADRWRLLRRQSRSAWDDARDAEARRLDAEIAEIESKVPAWELDRLSGKNAPGNIDPELWHELTRDLQDVEHSRETSVSVLARLMQHLPRPGARLLETDRHNLAVIGHALDLETQRGGDQMALLKDALTERLRRYGGAGSADARELVEDQMRRLRELLGQPERGPVAAISAPVPAELPERQATYAGPMTTLQQQGLDRVNRLGGGLFDDPRIILAEQQAQHLRLDDKNPDGTPVWTPEERAELEETQRALVEAEDQTRALQAAAACQKENEA